ncbi:MAG TPA: DUF2298 domain-containing protein [Candidatus Bathyarchaeia archaeon]|nr:DUF2298 domain-containing protein [Candidatus Bathyarchaeia archaeon]
MIRPQLIPYQCWTAAIGVLLLLPLQSFSLPLLFILPGLGFYVLYKSGKQIGILEAMSYSISLTLVLVPTAATVMYLAGVGVAMTGAALGLAVITVSILSFVFRKNSGKPPEPNRTTDSQSYKLVFLALPILLAVLLALVVSVPLSKSPVVSDEGLVMNPTEAGDLNFHLSIIARYVESPHIPPEDPYLPSHYVDYDFFMHVYVGTLSVVTSISSLTIFKITIPLLFSTLSINIYVLCRRTFRDATALIAMILYTVGGGLAWILILAQRPSDVFPYLIYQFGDTPTVKYDQTLLYYLLPQPQTFALVILAFAFILWVTLLKDLKARNLLLFGLVLGVLPYYHLITAFPLYVAVGIYVVYKYARRQVTCTKYHAGALAAGGAIASPLLFLLSGGPTQVAVAFSTYSLFFIFIVFGLIAGLACTGAYRSSNNEASKPLLIFAFSAVVAMNVVALPLTNNSYRFLVYLWLPVALFASYYISTVVAKLTAARFSSAKLSLKVLAIVAALILALPTSYLLWDFYNNESYVLASPAEVQALQWIKVNTPQDAIFLEAPSNFPRIPLETGRRVVFGGSIYTIQYHGVDLQTEIEALMNERSPESLSLSLTQLNVSYVFVGSREQQYEVATTLKDTNYFQSVYSNPMVTIYKVKNS